MTVRYHIFFFCFILIFLVISVWGWTDADGREIALVGCSNGVSFVDVSAPNQPLGVGFLPTHSVSSDWRDMKVYNDHVFVGSEASNHGIQVFNLRLITSALEQYAADQSAFVVISSSSGLKRLDVTYAESAWYGGVGKSTCLQRGHVSKVR